MTFVRNLSAFCCGPERPDEAAQFVAASLVAGYHASNADVFGHRPGVFLWPEPASISCQPRHPVRIGIQHELPSQEIESPWFSVCAHIGYRETFDGEGLPQNVIATRSLFALAALSDLVISERSRLRRVEFARAFSRKRWPGFEPFVSVIDEFLVETNRMLASKPGARMSSLNDLEQRLRSLAKATPKVTLDTFDLRDQRMEKYYGAKNVEDKIVPPVPKKTWRKFGGESSVQEIAAHQPTLL